MTTKAKPRKPAAFGRPEPRILDAVGDRMANSTLASMVQVRYELQFAETEEQRLALLTRLRNLEWLLNFIQPGSSDAPSEDIRSWENNPIFH
jgi:hypothetical protein